VTTSIEDILAVASDDSHRREATARVLLQQDLASRHAELEAELEAALAEFADQMDRPAHVRELAEQVQAVEAEIEAALIEFRFRAVSFREWADLLAKHPPTKKQREANPYVDHNPDTFPAVAVAAACVEPEMTAEQAGQLAAALPQDQWLLLWGTCAMVCRGDGAPKVSKAAGLILRSSGASARRATTTESDDPSS
jgi:hypothetical protein